MKEGRTANRSRATPPPFITNSERHAELQGFHFARASVGLVLVTSTVTADEKGKDENEAVVDGAAKKTIPVELDDVKQGCGRCCRKGGTHYCGRECCEPEKEATEAVENAAAYEVNPHGWGGGRGGAAVEENDPSRSSRFMEKLCT